MSGIVRRWLSLLAFASFAIAARGENALRVVQAGPEGEIASLAEANEIRVVFSRPMVALGKIPEPVRAPFFRIEPPLAGSFRWSGTTTLIFTPAARPPLPFGTKYRVTIDASAASAAGERLAEPYAFSFTTPTARLVRTSWYRRGSRTGSPLLVMLRFNQPVTPRTVAAHLALRHAAHAWEAPQPPGPEARLAAIDPKSAEDFRQKVQLARQAASRTDAVEFALATDWDKKSYPPSPDLVVLATRTAPPPDSWIEVAVAGNLPGRGGREVSGSRQSSTIKLEPTLFVQGTGCAAGCDPESYNPLTFRTRISLKALRPAVRVTDITSPGRERRLRRAPEKKARSEEDEELPETAEQAYESESDDYHPTASFSLEDVGYSLEPARTYLVEVARTLESADGQRLGYTWTGVIENWHERAFTSFEAGHGVWESSGGPQIPFVSRNLRTLTEWLSPIGIDKLLPTIVGLQGSGFSTTPPSEPRHRSLSPVPDRTQPYGLNLKPVLSPDGRGIAWAALQAGDPIPKSQLAGRNAPSSTVLQVTNLGITVKDSPANTLVFVTRLDDGRPVPDARVSIRTLENKVFWTGSTDAAGLAIAPSTDLRDHDRWYEFRFLVTAEKDGDVAYVGSDWNDGIEPWSFDLPLTLHEAGSLLRGRVFSDRGVYKLGEEVHFKAIARSDSAKGMALLPAGAKLAVVVRDSQGQEVDRRTLPLSEWCSADWTWTVPAQGPLGNYRVFGTVEGHGSDVEGEFLVAAYRRPDFRVDVNLAGDSAIAGATLKGVVSARYLFGAPMAGRSARWTFSREPAMTVPDAISNRYPDEQFAFLGWDPSKEGERPERKEIRAEEGTIDAKGELALDLETDAAAGVPTVYTLEGEVTDLSRQKIAGRSSFLLHPAPWYVGLKRPGYFADAARGIDTEVVAVGLDGKPATGVPVHLTLTQIQWHSVRRAEGKGFYTWESRREETPAGAWDVASGEKPAPLHVPIPSGGFFVLRARAQDGAERSTTTILSFYALGAGYTAWQRYDHNRIDLVPEKKTYRPGEVARIMIKSPWEKATALLTTEREGVRTQKPFELTSTQQTVEVPVGEGEIPNVYVSVVLVKGRTAAYSTEDQSDPGKPSFRIGYTELAVEDSRRRLTVGVRADREEYRPGAKARIRVTVQTPEARPGRAEVTLWAVDHGVLSLTGYKTPDLLSSVYVRKGLQVLNEDSRERIVSRRVLTPKGAEEGGGGGAESGPGSPVRKDFRVLAFWLGSVATDERGVATADVKLPESLTTYRIMAVAGDRDSRFGGGDSEIRISKPVLLKSAFPRFLAVGDSALFGSVAHSQMKEAGSAIVTMKSLDPALLEIAGSPRQTVRVPAQSAAEVRFPVRAKAPGRARIEMSIKLLGETDAFQETLPVEILSVPEVVAAYGQARPKAAEELALPGAVVPGFGGLHWELSSTAMVGLGEGARYLVDYPYGCAEQRASAALAVMLASDLGEAFRLPGIEPGKLRGVVASTLSELDEFQRPDGGFGYWKGEGESSPYLTSYVLHVYQKGKVLNYEVKPAVLEKGYVYLERVLGQTPPANEGWWPGYTAWQAFAAKVLVEGGRNEDSAINRLFGYVDRMPVFAISYLADAMRGAGEKSPRLEALDRRIANAMLPEGGTAHVEELSDPYLLWFWNSNVRTTAIVLGSFVRGGKDEASVTGIVSWLMKVRKNGRWGNTQENAIAMESLVDYYRRYEKEEPDFSALVSLGNDVLDREKFFGRSSEARASDLPMADLLRRGQPGEKLGLEFAREGTGTLFYTARLRYASAETVREPLDQGIAIERSYAPEEGKADRKESRSFKAGELVSVTLKLRLTKERRFLAVTDPLPAGLEPVESWFATTAADLVRKQESGEDDNEDWTDWWMRGGFDHVERHDDRVFLFATRLSEGEHTFRYVARATTSGTFQTAPAHAEEMYEPEVFGHTASDVVEIRP